MIKNKQTNPIAEILKLAYHYINKKLFHFNCILSFLDTCVQGFLTQWYNLTCEMHSKKRGDCHRRKVTLSPRVDVKLLLGVGQKDPQTQNITIAC